MTYLIDKQALELIIRESLHKNGYPILEGLEDILSDIFKVVEELQ